MQSAYGKRNIELLFAVVQIAVIVIEVAVAVVIALVVNILVINYNSSAILHLFFTEIVLLHMLCRISGSDVDKNKLQRFN